MANLCGRHRGKGARIDPAVDRLIRALPENQGRANRHKCTYCAYEEGYKKGRRDGRERVRRFIAGWLAGEEDDPPE